MNKSIRVAVILSLAAPLTIEAAPLSLEELLSEPTDFELSTCKYFPGEEASFELDWTAILPEDETKPVKKYATEVNCDVVKVNPDDEDNPFVLGTVEAESTIKASDCEGELCSTSIAYSEIDSALASAIESGEIALDEGTSVSDYGFVCSAKVKGLNPPGKSQNHPQAVAPCSVVNNENPEEAACPAWTFEELEHVRPHAGIVRELADMAIENDNYEFGEFKYYYNDFAKWLVLGPDDSISSDDFNYQASATVYELPIQFDTPVAFYSHRVEAGGDEIDVVPGRATFLETAEQVEACKQELLNHDTGSSCASDENERFNIVDGTSACFKQGIGQFN